MYVVQVSLVQIHTTNQTTKLQKPKLNPHLFTSLTPMGYHTCQGRPMTSRPNSQRVWHPMPKGFLHMRKPKKFPPRPNLLPKPNPPFPRAYHPPASLLRAYPLGTLPPPHQTKRIQVRRCHLQWMTTPSPSPSYTRTPR